jgi:acetoin:2,6-dichlorophenolindophenol oxidoreductase subunit beta
MPSNAYDAKGLLISSIEDNNPVIFLEHRWLHNTIDNVPSEDYRVPIGKAKIVRKGEDLTIVAHSYMVLEAIRCADILKTKGISLEVIDLRTIRPLDTELILDSVRKTGRLLVADNGWIHFGVSAEIISLVTESIFDKLLSPPQRVGMHDSPSPSTRALAQYFYPKANNIAKIVCNMLGKNIDLNILFPKENLLSDVPDPSFKGPF